MKGKCNGYVHRSQSAIDPARIHCRCGNDREYRDPCRVWGWDDSDGYTEGRRCDDLRRCFSNECRRYDRVIERGGADCRSPGDD
jgi:hypothetical protein